MNDNISDKDKKDWDSFINSQEKLPNKDIYSKDKKTFNVRSIDLHGYSLEEANKSLETAKDYGFNSSFVVTYQNNKIRRLN